MQAPVGHAQPAVPLPTAEPAIPAASTQVPSPAATAAPTEAGFGGPASVSGGAPGPAVAAVTPGPAAPPPPMVTPSPNDLVAASAAALSANDVAVAAAASSGGAAFGSVGAAEAKDLFNNAQVRAATSVPCASVLTFLVHPCGLHRCVYVPAGSVYVRPLWWCWRQRCARSQCWHRHRAVAPVLHPLCRGSAHQ